MNKTELEFLKTPEPRVSPQVLACRLVDQTDRTLLYGYTCDRDTWHVYLLGGEIFLVTYPFEGEPELTPLRNISDLIPNKRLYPESCDLEFCRLLKIYDTYLPFTGFNQERLERFENSDKPFWGKVL